MRGYRSALEAMAEVGDVSGGLVPNRKTVSLTKNRGIFESKLDQVS